MLEPQRTEREREKQEHGDGETARVFVLRAAVLLLRVERCLLGLARLVDSGPAWFNNTDQRIVIQNNNVSGQRWLLDEPAEGKHSQFSVSSVTLPVILDEDNLPR